MAHCHVQTWSTRAQWDCRSPTPLLPFPFRIPPLLKYHSPVPFNTPDFIKYIRIPPKCTAQWYYYRETGRNACPMSRRMFGVRSLHIWDFLRKFRVMHHASYCSDHRCKWTMGACQFLSHFDDDQQISYTTPYAIMDDSSPHLLPPSPTNIAGPSTLPNYIDLKKDGTVSKMRSHKGNVPVLPKTKQCPHCPATFTRTTHLNRHLRTRESHWRNSLGGKHS